MNRIFLRALTLLLAVSMLFVSACGANRSADDVTAGDSTTSTTVQSRESTTTTTAQSTTTTAQTDNTTTGTTASSTSQSVVLTKPTQTGTTAAKPTDPVEAFQFEFESWLENLTEYQKPIAQEKKVANESVILYSLTGAKNTNDYCVHIHTIDKSIRAVYVTVAEKDYDFIFSVLSYYVYQSLGMTQLDTDAFLAMFDAFPDATELSHKAEGNYRLGCWMPNEFMVFAVTDKKLTVSEEKVATALQSAECGGCYADDNRAMNYLTLTDSADSLGLTTDMLERALVNGGNRARLADVMKRAKQGEEITIGVIGGSVTEGAYASDYAKTSYAGLTYAWWKKTFPKAKVNFVNAGIGGTSSLYGVHRVQEDLLKYEPDFVIVEFGVNDCDHAYQTEAYANLIHRILTYQSQPAVMLLYVMNDNGSNNQEIQTPIGQHYNLPMISYRDAIWPEVRAGRFQWNQIGADYVHPTDFGHALIAELVISYLTRTYEDLSDISTQQPAMAKPYMDYVYENATYYYRDNLTPLSMQGFKKVNNKNCSWMGGAKSSITFEFTGKRCILAIPTTFKDNLDVSIRIDGGDAIPLPFYIFHGGAFANAVVFDSDTVAKHTIEIVCNSGTLYIGGLFIS